MCGLWPEVWWPWLYHLPNLKSPPCSTSDGTSSQAVEMESGGTPSISDWDRPFTNLELEAIEAVFQSAASPTPTPTPTTPTSTTTSSPIKQRRRHLPIRNDDTVTVRRRLPGSINGAHSPSLLPCRNEGVFTPYYSSSPAKLEMRYPAMAFKGQVLYSRTVAEVEKAAKELLKIVETRKRGVDQVIIGFDIEWRPTFRRGVPPRKVAVMQICCDPCYCYVMHITHSGIPQSLRSLLEDPTSLKVGVGIANDACKVYNDYNISMTALEELSGLANQKFGGVPKKWSLASLTEKLICKQLPKPGKIRLGNWEADILSNEQLQYAATDAFASWYLYQSLKTLPEATDNRTEEIVKSAVQ